MWRGVLARKSRSGQSTACWLSSKGYVMTSSLAWVASIIERERRKAQAALRREARNVLQSGSTPWHRHTAASYRRAAKVVGDRRVEGKWLKKLLASAPSAIAVSQGAEASAPRMRER